MKRLFALVDRRSEILNFIHIDLVAVSNYLEVEEER
jgi:hypothetical protein